MNKIKAGVPKWLKTQFGRPSGFWGSLAGTIMAHRSSNRERARWTVDLLDIQAGERVLEIGFGPGVAIARIVERDCVVFVVGIDHSEVMLRQAAGRNAEAIRQGRVDLRLASVEALPRFERPFHKIFSINSVDFWSEPVERLEVLREFLVPGGRLFLTVQPRGLGADASAVERTKKRLENYLLRAGFTDICREIKQMRGTPAVAVHGKRPPSVAESANEPIQSHEG